MDNSPDLWEEQIARFLRSYREPAVPEDRLREIGEEIARRLAESDPVEANLNAVLPFYKEPEIDADRLARIGQEIASQLQPPADETPRRLRAVRRHPLRAPSNRAPMILGLAAAAAVFLVIVLANLFSPAPAPQPRREEAKRTPIEVPPPALIPAPREEPKPPAPPEKPRLVEEKPRETPPVPDPVPPPAPTPRPAPPEPRKETPKPVAPPTVTEPARPTEVARIERVQGEVFILGDAGKVAAKAGDPILPARGLQAAGRESSALVRYADQTTVELGPETTVSRFDEGDKRVAVAQGIVTSHISRQPAGRSMIFTTPHAEAKVVGTKLTLWVRPDWTRLEVREGRVRFTRTADGSGADVGVDQYAVAVAGPKPVARRTLPANLKGLLEDFEDPLGVETRWQPFEGGLPRSTLGVLELDLSPRPNESYQFGGWHTAWGMRTRQHFPVPLRVSVDIEHTEKHVNANALVVLVPKDPGPAGVGNEVAVHLRDTDYGILVGGKPVKTVNRNWTPPLKERWTVEFDRREVRFLADGKLILRHAHGLAQVPAEYRVELHGGAKMDTPAGARIRYDNVRIEP